VDAGEQARRGQRMTPLVSFIVPCYKLAHLLQECISSILEQTYENFEILVLDDDSPDNTPEVVQFFNDPRVKHIRNNPNLGHLKNYNKGIGLARGEYIWLISADDRLRSPHVLYRYVELMERHPNIGYVFCRGVGLQNSKETGIIQWGDCGEVDAVWNGRTFLRELLIGNRVISAAGMVRRECYEKISVFPLDLPYAGDWYLWCVFALHYDVGYFSDPMISYRVHEMSMTSNMKRRHTIEDNLSVLWRLASLAKDLGYTAIEKKGKDSIANQYAYCVSSDVLQTSLYALSLEEFEQSLDKHTASPLERREIRARVYSHLGSLYHQQEECPSSSGYGWSSFSAGFANRFSRGETEGTGPLN
jgi:glycosyltransferase involved in cell wall biosynthesis